jgi:predicted double-glycine peptidase
LVGFLLQSHEDLQKLKVPAILYVKFRELDHFVVLRGISKHLAWLGDPSAGNLVLTPSQLREVWETRNDPRYQGKVLLVLPAADISVHTNKNFFRTPTTSALPAKLLGIRAE